MAYEMVMPYHLHMPSYFLETFTEYPDLSKALNGETDRYWMLDCSAASENLLLAAESMGLGAVWTAVYPENDRIAKVRSVLSLPDHIIPFNLIPVGYPQHREEAKDKFKTENIHYNKW